MQPPTYTADFDDACYLCERSPCVVILDHPVPHTMLCGPHFFQDQSMDDWYRWNDQKDVIE